MNIYTEKIDRYLLNIMEADERIQFEDELKTNKQLQEELYIQKQLMQAIETGGIRAEIKTAANKHKFKQTLIKWVAVVGVVAALSLVGMYIYNFSKHTSWVNEEGTNAMADADRELPSLMFEIDSEKDTIFETPSGILVAIAANTFKTKNGQPISGKINFEIKEAIAAEDIIKAGLSTMADDKLLETAGMFYTNATQDGEPLEVAKNIQMNIPTANKKNNMQLFNGVRKPDGNINWVNPKPIDKQLVTYDMDKLDFYPPGYIKIVRQIGLKYQNKKYTDSLYYSFSGYNPPQVNNESVEISNAIYDGESKNSIPKYPEWTVTTSSNNFKAGQIITIHIKGIIDNDWWVYSNDFSPEVGPNVSDLKWEKNNGFELIGKATPIGNRKEMDMVFGGEVSKFKGVAEFRQTVKLLKDNPTIKGTLEYQTCSSVSGLCLLDKYFFTVTNGDAGRDCSSNTQKEIDPAHIAAFWHSRFNKTILATKEFEERMQFIFSTCSCKYIDLYKENLQRNIYEIDSLCMNLSMINGNNNDYQKFKEFYNRKDGEVKIKSELQNRLNLYAAQRLELIKKIAAETWKKYNENEARLDAKAQRIRNTYNELENIRESETYNEEFCMNLINAYQQIGQKKVCPIKWPVGGGNYTNDYYSVPVATVGWHNLDAYVFEATTNRTTLDYTDPVSGKKAIIRYEPITIHIDNEQQYDRVLVYLIPDSLSSFQRINKKGEIYTEKLNELLHYDILAVAYKGSQIYSFKQPKAHAATYTFALKETSERELKKLLKTNTKSKSNDIKNDLFYQQFEVDETKRIEQRLKFDEMRREIAHIIFPCREWNYPSAQQPYMYDSTKK